MKRQIDEKRLKDLNFEKGGYTVETYVDATVMNE